MNTRKQAMFGAACSACCALALIASGIAGVSLASGAAAGALVALAGALSVVVLRKPLKSQEAPACRTDGGCGCRPKAGSST